MNRYPVTKDKPNFKPSLPHCSLRTADAFPVVGSLPPKNSVAIFRKIATLYTFLVFHVLIVCIFDASNANVINWKVKK